ncbi:cysteine--tRNA ligase [Sporichthya sp.]|uniref:cysteine--tRNA ligase n=1 Tax=Sporichthya sp. TaxID=65475 RepID=UPI0018387664|nr:cysteine--tRNA ligase [Sporichthya sp.]MBA3742869.1 cysteine--tRNA ligase [Sporichthya sp.]
MTLRLYDTATRSTRDFVPAEPGRASIYLCGATVQAPPHIGHIRSGVNFDILRRWLEHTGSTVTFVRNVTDIDDKILRKGEELGVPWWQVAQTNENAFGWAYDVLGCLRPTIEPRATGHVPEMIVLMRELIERGHAYADGGDVYFSVGSFGAYGALSGQKPDAMLAAGDTDVETHKRDARDFALWKSAKPGEPSWETPWGPGRPGWHLECSAMAGKYLGDRFDIHGGGLDLVFPHHENEIAQSKAAGGDFAAYWLHNGWVTMSGEKMSKSLGNSLLVSEVVKRVRPVELRFFLAAPHYRSMVEYSEESLTEAGTAYQRIETFVRNATDLVGDVTPGQVPAAFTEAMDDDLGTPQALAAIYHAVREGNTAMAAGDKDTVTARLTEARAMLGVLGLDPVAWADGNSGGDLHGVVDGLVALALEQRAAARERKDYAAADAIRDRLRTTGVVIEDTPNGPRWTVDPGSAG